MSRFPRGNDGGRRSTPPLGSPPLPNGGISVPRHSSVPPRPSPAPPAAQTLPSHAAERAAPRATSSRPTAAASSGGGLASATIARPILEITDDPPHGPPGPWRPALISAGLTDVGRQRKHNEDNILVRPELGLFVVADGMGGHSAGDIASKLTTTSLQNFFEATEAGPIPGEPTDEDRAVGADARRLLAAVRKANHDVFEISTTYQQHQGMGSTLVSVYVPRATGVVHIAHVGDSRCYRVRGGRIEQLTKDHSLINDALELKPDLTEGEIARLPKNIITRALGMKELVKIDVRTESLCPGDTFLLCSDGLSGLVKEAQILEVIEITDDVDEVCELLVAMANEAGGTDNISAVVVRIEEHDEEHELVEVDTLLSAPPPRPSRISMGPDYDAVEGVDSAPDVEIDVMTDEDVDEAIGSGLPSSEVVAVAAPEEAVEEEEAFPRDALAKFTVARCRECDHELFVGNVFCVECGARID